ncbi:UNVERIFIED_CONTAM: putative receptor-like protein kinase [Sesamum calycinum]|uniref:non-specific serine/threonine protein kinase n=1 Tax=Sesamum calycinum TaxID=2727403 RepID=A0AAW2Q456_9LAMI
MSSESLNAELSKKYGALKLWVLIGICVGAFIVLILGILSIWVMFRRKSRRTLDKYSLCQIPNVSKDIRVDRVGTKAHDHLESYYLTVNDKSSDKNSEKFVHLGGANQVMPIISANAVQCIIMKGLGALSQERKGVLAMPGDTLHCQHVIGEGGYGVVYRGRLVNGTEWPSGKEFRVEVEAIGHVRHKNLVRLLGYCIEGVHRMLVYEYVNNGNLEQWLHGAMRQHGTLTWEARMKVLLGTAKALAYLHEAIEPKVVHRDIKSSNILIDDEFNAKVSDFGLAKLLGSGESHITTRVMGTFGYVAPEYANTGLLNEKSDIYSFGVLLLEAVTGRDPVDYGRPADEVNLVEWLKMMVGNRRAEEVVDPNLEVKPTTRALKRALLVALRCVDPDSEKRPKMSHVVRMLETDDYPYREDRRSRKSRTTSMDIESTKDGSGSAEMESRIERSGSQKSETTDRN